MDAQTLMLLAFVGGTGALLILDLAVLNRGGKGGGDMRAALTSSAVWVGCALAFGLALLSWRGSETAVQFLTGYLIELSLSIDNLFVFLLLFAQFAVPPAMQHRVLFWGVLGAIVMRVGMIAAGSVLVTDFHWVLYVFGAFLAVTGIRMLLSSAHDAPTTAELPLMRWLRGRLPVSDTTYDGRFVVREGGRRMLTPLFIVLLSVEMTDLLFAIDSVPAVFAVTTDTFVVATSNIFAILGLRSLYFALSGLMERLRYLKYGLAAVLIFIGVKLTLAGVYPIPAMPSLAVTLGILAVAIVASLLKTAGAQPKAAESYEAVFNKQT